MYFAYFGTQLICIFRLPIVAFLSLTLFFLTLQEQKIREGLYMMGLKDEIFHLSWFITYALQFALCSGIITACTMGSLFKYSDKTLVFTYFFLFGLSAIMLSFMISTFFTRAKTAVAVGTLTFLGAFFPYYTVNDESVSMYVCAFHFCYFFRDGCFMDRQKLCLSLAQPFGLEYINVKLIV
jgi:ATP-binding cassette subfamily A (ABC1) protein 3